jgi:predicted porin
MKNTPSSLTLAATAVLALAGSGAGFSASAQGTSSITLYGIVDAGVEHLNNVAAGGSLSRMPSTTSLVPSRWGLRGSEDLGGGLKAIYPLESGFAPDQGTFNQGGRGFGRQSWVGLGGNWGSLTLGRQNSMLFWSLIDSDIIGPAVFAMGSLDAYIPNSRADNKLAWRGHFGGLALGAGYSFGRDAVNAGPSPAGTNCPGESGSDTQACRQWSLYAKYDTPAWGMALGYEQQNGRTPASAADPVFGGMTSSAKHDEGLHLGGGLHPARPHPQRPPGHRLGQRRRPGQQHGAGPLADRHQRGHPPHVLSPSHPPAFFPLFTRRHPCRCIAVISSTPWAAPPPWVRCHRCRSWPRHWTK